jgi:hypothetical protein
VTIAAPPQGNRDEFDAAELGREGGAVGGYPFTCKLAARK